MISSLLLSLLLQTSPNPAQNMLWKWGGSGGVSLSGTNTWTGTNNFTSPVTFSSTARFNGINGYFVLDTLKIQDASENSNAVLTTGSSLSAERFWSFNFGDANRTLTMTGDASLNQSVLTTSSPTFVALTLGKTIIAAGTTGAQTINNATGCVNFAAAATTLVVTNSLAATTSVIMVNAMTNDATCNIKDVERAAGSFTIRMTAACTAETAACFLVTN